MDTTVVEELAKNAVYMQVGMHPPYFFLVPPLCTSYRIKKINVM